MVGLNLGILAFFLVTQASRPWHYVADSAAMAASLTIGLGLAAHARQSYLDTLRRFQAQLVMRMVELQEMAARDELTHLYNRRYFYERLPEGLDRARSSKQPLALVIIDVDDLKAINDNYGHRVGDCVLKNLAQIMTKHTRANDVAARLGGDEFGIVMPDTDKRGAFGLARRLWRELEEKPIYEENGIQLWLTVSIGVSGFPWGGEDVDEMMHWADTDMYANKVSRKLPVSPIPDSKGLPDLEKAPSDYA